MHSSHLPTSLPVIEARKACEGGLIPRKAYDAFKAQHDTAKRRGIPFLFSISEWWNWWQVDGRWHHRGIGANKLVMARKGDVGPYSPENVFCCTHLENVKSIDKDKLRTAQLARCQRNREDPGFQHHLAVRGDGHPRSRAVITPMGRFGSIALAAEAHGLTRQGAGSRARAQRNGWRYESP